MTRSRLLAPSVLFAALLVGTGCPPEANTPPTADDQAVSLDEDGSLAITLTGVDADGDTLTFATVTDVTNGTLSGDAPNLTYTPTADFNGSDTFTFTVSDAEATSAEATVTITVNPVNDAPTLDGLTGTTDEDVAVDITLAGSDIEGDSLTYSVGTDPGFGTATVSGSTVTYTPNTDANGTDTFTIIPNDGTDAGAAATVTVTVNPVNDAPTATSDAVTTDEDTPVDITLVGADLDGDALTFAVTVNPTSGTLTGTAPALNYAPNADFNGTDQFTFTVSDGTEVATATVDLTVTAVNDAPVMDAGTDRHGLVGLQIGLSRTATDIESATGALTWSWSQTGGPTAAIADATAATTTFRAWAAGVYTFDVTVSDGDLTDTDSATIQVVDLAGGGAHSVYVKSDGTLWAWGMNDTVDGGALGDGTRNDAAKPVQVLGADGSTYDSDWAAASAGDAHTLALKTDGTLWAWGSNAQGAVGTGAASDKPVKIGTDTDWRYVAAGSNFSLAVKSDGTLYGWGIGTLGQLGDACTLGSTCTAKGSPALSDSAGGWVKIVAGDRHAAGLKDDGSLWTWGRGIEGQLGTGCTPNTDCVNLTTPTRVGTGTGWVDVAVGQDVTIALDSAGAAWAFGEGAGGRLGTDSLTASATPTEVCTVGGTAPCNSAGVTGVTSIAIADGSAIATTSDGRLLGWGAAATSLLLTNTSDLAVPAELQTGVDLLGTGAGRSHAMVVTSTLQVLSWGTNTNGQVGDGSAFSQVPVLSGTFDKVSTQGRHVLGVKADGSLWAWGSDTDNGELGDATDRPGNSSIQIEMGPVPVCGDPDLTNDVCLTNLTGVSTAIDAGASHNQVILTDGTRWTWGKNSSGQVGDGTKTTWWFAVDGKDPVTYNWTRVLSGTGPFSAGLQDDGAGGQTLWTWGRASWAYLGLGPSVTADQVTPQKVGTDTDWSDIAGGQHMLAVKTGGALWAWGRNDQGLVGDGSADVFIFDPRQVCLTYDTGTTSCTTPFTGVRTVAASGTVSVAVKNDDTVWTWGPNTLGQLGDGGANALAKTPIQVCAVGESSPCSNYLGNIDKVSAGPNHVVALGKDGKLYAWGLGVNGELGDGSFTSSNVPVEVLGVDGGAPETDWVDVEVGNGFTLARKSNGMVYAWGTNVDGAFGIGRGPLVLDPTAVGF